MAGHIAEGCGKPTDEEFAKCVGTALGLANRLEYFALVAIDLSLLETKKYELLNDKVVELSKMLSSFWQRLKKSGRNPIDY